MVMYRDFTARNARRFGLVGMVHNNADGSVLVIAEGEESILLEFLELLKKGSLLSKVEDVLAKWGVATGEYHTFTIAY